MENASGHRVKRSTHARQYLFPSELGITMTFRWTCSNLLDSAVNFPTDAAAWRVIFIRWRDTHVWAHFRQSVLIDGQTYCWVMSLTVVLIPGQVVDAVEHRPTKGLRQERPRCCPCCIAKHCYSCIWDVYFSESKSRF